MTIFVSFHSIMFTTESSPPSIRWMLWAFCLVKCFFQEKSNFFEFAPFVLRDDGHATAKRNLKPDKPKPKTQMTNCNCVGCSRSAAIGYFSEGMLNRFSQKNKIGIYIWSVTNGAWETPKCRKKNICHLQQHRPSTAGQDQWYFQHWMWNLFMFDKIIFGWVCSWKSIKEVRWKVFKNV